MNVNLGLNTDSHNITEAKITELSGYIYNTEGVFIEKKGKSTKVFAATSYTKDAKGKYTYTSIPTDLNISHSDFCYISYVVRQESGNEDIEELKCIAFSSYNYSKSHKKTWKKIMNSGYSSVPHKIELADSKIDNRSNLARKAVISVLLGENDITNGAEFWDGTDFLAWGTNENKYDSATKIGHNKFREFKFIEIPRNVYDKYLSANINSAPIYTIKINHETCSGKHEHLTKKDPGTDKIVKTGKIKYPMPAEVFEDQHNWNNNYFYYETGVDVTNGISGTIASGKSIFWKPLKNRINSTSTSVNESAN